MGDPSVVRPQWTWALCPQKLHKWGKDGAGVLLTPPRPNSDPMFEAHDPVKGNGCPPDPFPFRDPGVLAQLSQDTLKWMILAVLTSLQARSPDRSLVPWGEH